MKPQEIQDTAIPLLEGGQTPTSGKNNNPIVVDSEVELPHKIPDLEIPVPNIASDVIATSINTETKSILGEYSFEQLGALIVGMYKSGVSGQIKISPDGIIATDKNGNESIRLDGDTGDGTFFGIVKAAGFDVIDTTGLISANNFLNADIFDGSSSNNTSSTSLVDLPGSALAPFTLTRPTNVYVGVMGYGYNDQILSSHGANYGVIEIYDAFDATTLTNIIIPGLFTTYTPDGLTFYQNVRNMIYVRTSIELLAAGTHTLSLQYKSVNGGTTNINAFELFYIILGN